MPRFRDLVQPGGQRVPRRSCVLTARRGVEITQDELLAHCRQHLAGFKTPKKLFFVDSLPKNPSGKLLKRVLRDRFA